MKLDFTTVAILALVVVVIAVPAVLYAANLLSPDQRPSISSYCSANGYLEVYPCIDGAFQAIREDYTEGFSIVKSDGSLLECPFTLPQYQTGECADYTTAGMCGGQNLCGIDGSCVSDLDCEGKCVNWTCG